MPKLRMNQAITAAVADEMRADATVILMGEDVADAGGPFKTSEGLLEEFGAARVRDTPISEMGFLGAAVGAASWGLRPIVEIMFVEFLGVALDQLVTEAAKLSYLSGGEFQAPLTVRASVGAGLGFGSQHSQTLENWFTSTPGLKVVTPSDPQTAYGLVRAAIRDDGPVIVLEPRALYGQRGDVDTGAAAMLTIGQGRTLREGSDVTVVAMGQMVGVAAAAMDEGLIDGTLIDLLSLVPWDRERVLESVRRTGRLVVVEESPQSGGWGEGIVAAVAAEAFSSLKAPPLRITCPDVPVPYNPGLEKRFLPTSDYVVNQVTSLIQTGTLPKPWWEQRA